jgi:hypothetical protein
MASMGGAPMPPGMPQQQSYYSFAMGGMNSIVYFLANLCVLFVMCGAILAWMGGAGVTFNIDNAYLFWHWWCVYGIPSISCCGLIYIISHITYELRRGTNYHSGGGFAISTAVITMIWFIYSLVGLVLVAALVACIIYYGAFIVAHCADHSLCYGPHFLQNTVSIGAILWLTGTGVVVLFSLIALVMCLYLWFSARQTTIYTAVSSIQDRATLYMTNSKIGDKIPLVYNADEELDI